MATGRLNVSPSEFWSLTPMELMERVTAFIRAKPGYVPPVTMAEFEALKKMFPDKVVIKHGAE